MDNKTDFILAAVSDAQATIRSIDTKIGVLLAGLLLPFSSMGKIWNHLVNIASGSCPLISILIGIAFFSLWTLTITSLIRAISAIDNPSKHIISSNEFKGVFYGGGYYQLGFIDAFFNRSLIKADRDVTTQLTNYPATQGSIDEELAFEHLKLIYIRDIKVHRLNCALEMASIWFILGVAIYVFSKFC